MYIIKTNWQKKKILTKAEQQFWFKTSQKDIIVESNLQTWSSQDIYQYQYTFVTARCVLFCLPPLLSHCRSQIFRWCSMDVPFCHQCLWHDTIHQVSFPCGLLKCYANTFKHFLFIFVLPGSSVFQGMSPKRLLHCLNIEWSFDSSHIIPSLN